MSGTLDKPALGTNIAFIWGALNFGCWLYVYLFIPELRGLELEAVDELYVAISSVTNILVLTKRSLRDEQLDGFPRSPISKVVRNLRRWIQVIRRTRGLLRSVKLRK
jgi:hypothetical protein